MVQIPHTGLSDTAGDSLFERPRKAASDDAIGDPQHVPDPGPSIESVNRDLDRWCFS